MSHNPLEQFKIVKILNLHLLDHDISLTNSSLFMIMSALVIILYLIGSLKKMALIPSRFQMSGEIFYQMIHSMINQNIGNKGKKYLPLIFTLFMFILICNLLGMMPYGFTVTSNIFVTLVMAIILFIFITFLGLYLHGMRFFSLFLPSGTPLWMAPLMIVIELFVYLVKPVSLSLRLTANMVAGHVLLKVMAGFVVTLALYLKIMPIPFIVVLVGFEIFIAVLQAYIFAMLSCVYLNDAINLH